MKIFSFVAAFLATLATVNAFAAPTTIQLGNAVNYIDGKSYDQYQVTVNFAVARAYSADSNSKLFGAWKKCFTRTVNVPYEPFAPYNYTPFSTTTRVENLFKVNNDNRTIVRDEAAVVSELEMVEQLVTSQTKGECDIESSIHMEISTFIPAISSSIRTNLFISKQNGKVVVSFSQWAKDRSGAYEVNEYLPNPTPVEIGYPY